MTDLLDLAVRVGLALAVGAIVGVGGYRLHTAILRRADRIRTGRRDDSEWWVGS